MSAVDFSLASVAGVMLLFVWFQDRGNASIGLWGVAHLILAIALLLLATGGATGDQKFVKLGVPIMLFAYALMWSAARLFERRELISVAIFAGPALWVAAQVSGQANDTLLTIGAAVLAVYSLAAGVEYWRGRAEPLMSRWPAILLLGVTGIGFLSWIAFDFFMPLTSDLRLDASDWFAPVILVTVLGRIALAMIVIAMAKERLELRQRMEALTDPLTGLPNRRAFFRAAARRLRQHRRASRDVAVLAFDIDRFKRINDKHGHAFGDVVLQRFAEVLSGRLQADDVIGRLGGEEFAAVLMDADLGAAMSAAERVRAAFENAAAEINGIRLRGTVSVGVASSMCNDCDLPVLLAHADAALYAAKKAGRNRVEIADGRQTPKNTRTVRAVLPVAESPALVPETGRAMKTP